MTAKSKRGLRALGIFLCVMALMTFFSRTLYTATLPRVTVTPVEDGTLSFSASGARLILSADAVLHMAIAQDLSQTPLTVADVLVKEGDRFNAGDALVQFDAIRGEISLQDAQAALKQAEEGLNLWDMRWMERWNELTLQRMQYEAQLQEPNANMDELLLRMEMLDEEFRQLEQDKLLDGSYRKEYEEAYVAAKAAAECLSTLAAQDWRLLADCGGHISKIDLQAGARYEGRLPALHYVLAGNASVKVGIAWNDSSDISGFNGVTVTHSAGAMYANPAISWTFAGESFEGGQRVLWARTADELPSLSELGALRFEMESAYYRYLVPNSAVSGGTVYILETGTGAWGDAANYVRAVNVSVLESDDRYTAVEGGISAGAQLVMSWDRPIFDGAEVYVEN